MIQLLQEQLVPISFTETERRLLIDVIDIHVAGVEQSKVLTTDDPTIESAEQLLDLMAGYDDDLNTLNEIRKRLNTPPARRRRFGIGYRYV